MESTRSKYIIFLLLAFSFTYIGCSPVFEKRFPDIYGQYTSFQSQKALAVAWGSNGGYAYGYGYGAKTIKEAKEQAMFQCNARRKVYQLDTECEIYMVNDRKVDK